jgi:cysteine-S-conjugate beta-lyase
MLHHEGLDRRAFLRSAGITAVGSAIGASAPQTVAAHAISEPADGKFDFDTPYSRVGTDCTKWDAQMALYGKDKIDVGMGIADMDFKGAPCVTKAVLERIQHENYGYLTIPASHNQAIIDWNRRRYGVEIKPEWLLHSPSIHPAILSVLRAFSPPGSKVIVQSPVYNAFYTDIRAVGCTAEENPLKLVNGRYAMDFDDLDRRISHDTHTLILCNPHNPTGNVWSRQDLMTLGELCTRRRVLVLADEVHCDFVMKGQTYTPYSTLGNDAIVRNSITFKSTSKSFNLAAMKCGYMFSSNTDYLARIKAFGHREDLTSLGMVACRAAYSEGAEWLDQVVNYIDGNHEFVESFVKANIPLIKYVKAQGTYLTWVDVGGLSRKIDARARADEETRKPPASKPPVTPETMVERYLVEHAHVHMNAGAQYGLGGADRMRMNIGTSRKTLQLALSNLAEACRKA